jgi:hypothetical protein
MLVLVSSQEGQFRYNYIITLTTSLDQPITRESFFNPNDTWFGEDIVASFNEGMYQYLQFSSKPGAGLLSVNSRWKDRQTIVLTIILDKNAYDNTWIFVGSNAGAQALIPIFNNARQDNTDYEFREISVTSSRTFAAHCINNFIDVDETDLNCGGNDCVACEGAKKCKVDGDCIGGLCLPDGTNTNIVMVNKNRATKIDFICY